MDIAILGGKGHIGSATASVLAAQGHHTMIFSRSDFDVADPQSSYSGPQRFDAVVYCVGHCPPGGFKHALMPLSQAPREYLAGELGMHVAGTLTAFQEFLPYVRTGGNFIFMSSAAVRLLEMPLDKRPPQVQIYAHLAAIAAENALIEGMRMDPAIQDGNLLIHKISPPAVGDSPFHKGGPALPATVTTAEVTEAIVGCLTATDHMDVWMAPKN